ncbi:MAG: hypothetical protein WBS19_15375 [Candidatus Korobacteraceae bacterium]
MADRNVEDAAARFLFQMHEALTAFIAKHPAVAQANAVGRSGKPSKSRAKKPKA